MKIYHTPYIYILLFGQLVHLLGDQNLSYSTVDSFIIPYGMSTQLSISLTTSSSEYISNGQILINQNITQLPSQNQHIPFNILIFNLTTDSGRNCYLQYFNSQEGKQLRNITCQNITQNLKQLQYLRQNGCINLTGCINDSIKYEIMLGDIQNNQAVIFIENNHTENSNKTSLKLETTTRVTIISSNDWFFWTVGLTCLLVINLIVATGVVLYWSIKYKKTKRRYQQFKITQVNHNDGIQNPLKQQ